MTKTQKQKPFWQGLEEIQDTPEFEEFLDREYPVARAEFNTEMPRRRWLQLMGASFALGVAGCRFENETIAPFAHRPQNRIPGGQKKFATTIEYAGATNPLLVTSIDGRPIKVDGNPDHPDSGGASNSYLQASILEFYDPFRSRDVLHGAHEGRETSDWEAFDQHAASIMKTVADQSGSGFCVLAEPSTSPSQKRLKAKLLQLYPQAQWFEFSPVNDDNSIAGNKLAFGQSLRTQLELSKAKTIVTLDADILGDHDGALQNQRQWAAGRNADHGEMSRVYTVESQVTITGMNADSRLPLRSDQIAGFVGAIDDEVTARLASNDLTVDESLSHREKFVACIAADLVKDKGQSVIVAGRNQSPEVHAQVQGINSKLGNIGNALWLREIDETASSNESLTRLVEQATAKRVDHLLVLGGNPVYDAPSDIGFQAAFESVGSKIHLSLYDNETSRLCDWHLNSAHPLEAWSDSIASDGSWCVGQPLIEPLHGGRSAIELLASLLDDEDANGRNITRATASSQVGSIDSDSAWNQAKHDGFVKMTNAAPADVAVTDFEINDAGDAWKTEGVPENGDLEIVFFPCGKVYDGRFANNSWLQELPDSSTKVGWDNAALISPATAEKLNIEHNHMVTVTVDGDSITLPAYVMRGQAAGSIGIALGYGRTAAGHVGGDDTMEVDSVGVDTNPIRKQNQWYVASKASVAATGDYYQLAQTQDKYDDDELGKSEIQYRVGEKQSIIRWGTLDEYNHFKSEDHATEDHATEDHATEDHGKEGHAEAAHGAHHTWPEHHLHFANEDLNPGPKLTTTNRWGMSIDLNTCLGCNGCVTACQSENNIPVVGREEMVRGRELHWLRLDRYFVGEDDGNVDDPIMVTQPMTCQQCEKAPCEQVCPVAATVHSSEGLNDMVYNRCIGTRYCGNNCPYKVRRFNYLNYSDAPTLIKYPWDDDLTQANQELQNLMMNPEVTVRSRGVMEKCTYCVQRIQNVKIEAGNEGREIGPNEIKTACQEVCPTNAIKFGDLSNEKSDVHAAHASDRAYTVLEELNNFPRTKYLARIRNPHKALERPWDRSVKGREESADEAAAHEPSDA